MKFRKLLLTLALCAMCVGQACALKFTYDAPEDYLFGMIFTKCFVQCYM